MTLGTTKKFSSSTGEFDRISDTLFPSVTKSSLIRSAPVRLLDIGSTFSVSTSFSASTHLIIDDISLYEEKPAENLETNSNEVPQLFSDEVNPSTSSEDNLTENLKNEEEEFEIPAFLRKQKF